MSYAKGPQEQMLALYFDHDMRFLGIRRLHVGAQTNVMADAREIVLGGLEMRAAATILVHNHPSGDPAPSEADRRLTTRLAEASKLLQVQLLDHVIVGSPDNGRTPWFSFKQAVVL
jgi:DNA repair protein RadC